MPTYEYKCFACGHQFEAFQKISEAPLDSCPTCTSGEVKRLLSAAPFHLKGAGWYATDYGKNGNGHGKSAANQKQEGDSEAKKADSGGSESQTETGAGKENKDDKGSDSSSEQTTS